MKPVQQPVGRRAFLGAVALAPLAGCSTGGTPSASPPVSAVDGPPSSPANAAGSRRHEHLVALERKFGARLGVFARATGTGATIVHRADERFAFCSTFKGLAAAGVLAHNPLSHLDTVIRYTEADLMKHTPVTGRHVATGMTIRQLCDAAVRFSDGTAGNLLLRDLGGPARLTAYARSLGDTVTRMDRTEPDITEATPGDPRDTSSPRALGGDYREIVLGDALPPDKRAFLRDLLTRSVTGDRRIRAGVPRGWTVAGKTGTGAYGTLHDIAIAWPPKQAAPLVIAIMTSKSAEDAEGDEALIAAAAEYVVATL
ncbi:class A beta-lactamase [Streptomyces sp. NPDC052042]|uniref:class A beta-lactamase n=1 Tax=Streptomyces sp. NPDC052042 TaxID=3365683 RepID=UPI0037D81061